MSWVESVPPVDGPLGSGFGSAVALDANVMAVGAPLFNESGAVYSFIYSADGNWELVSPLVGEESGDKFGTAVDVLSGQMVVGAPFRPIVDTLTPAGAAYFYVYNPTTAAWEQIGPAIRSDEDILAANGEFGTAVALGLSTLPRIVVGAPKTNTAMETLETGKVYTFESKGNAWNALETSPLLGKNAYDWFGASVDMASDGARFIAGAPGNGTGAPGYFQIFEWDGTQWNLDFELDGSSGEALGSSVVVLSNDSDIFAIGGPGFENGAGRVMVYQRQSSLQRSASDYMQLGTAVVGAPGDRLGSPGSLTGGVDDVGLFFIVGTDSGDIQSFGFDPSTGLWTPRFETLSTGSNGGVIEYSNQDGLMAGFASEDRVTLYNTVATSGAPMNTATTVPASAPVAGATPTQSPAYLPISPTLPSATLRRVRAAPAT